MEFLKTIFGDKSLTFEQMVQSVYEGQNVWEPGVYGWEEV